MHRDDRYAEKLATPDTSVGDLIGDVDPIKVAQGRTLGDPETIHFGLVPRMHRGIFAVNELPDLAERIQVAMLNVLEERDVQVRGYVLRLPLDLLLVASANPEDYTNRGRIITPLKDRFGAEIRTHYPLDVELEVELVRQEAALVAEVPEYLLELLARFTQSVRESPSVDARSGVSARFAIAGAETVAAAALRRTALLGEEATVARVGDTEAITATLRGKVEFEADGEGREIEILDHLLRRATAETWRRRLGGLDLSELLAVATAEAGVVAGRGGRLGAAAEPVRAGSRARRAAHPTGPARGAHAGPRRQCGRVRPRRAAPHPAPGQGRAGRRSDRLRRVRGGLTPVPAPGPHRRSRGRPLRAVARRP